MHLALSTRWDGRDFVVEMDGELDMASAPQLHSSVAAVLASPPPQRVLLVCGRLRFCDAAGLGALVGVQRELTRAGAGLVLVNPSRPLLRVLKVTSLEPHFAVTTDLPTGRSAEETAGSVDGKVMPSGRGVPAYQAAGEDSDPPGDGDSPGEESPGGRPDDTFPGGSREPPQR